MEDSNILAKYVFPLYREGKAWEVVLPPNVELYSSDAHSYQIRIREYENGEFESYNVLISGSLSHCKEWTWYTQYVAAVRCAARMLDKGIIQDGINTENWRGFLDNGTAPLQKTSDRLMKYALRRHEHVFEKSFRPIEFLMAIDGNHTQINRAIKYCIEKQWLSSMVPVKYLEGTDFLSTDMDLNPEKVEELERRLSLRIDPAENRFFKLVDLEIEHEGPFVFVIMPFGEKELNQLYSDVIKPCIEETLNSKCVRNDEDVRPGQLDDKFYSHIVKCKFLIAELTSENRNVVYELGIAHALNKDVIILVNEKQMKETLGFDYNRFLNIRYTNGADLKSQLQAAIHSLGRKLNLI